MVLGNSDGPTKGQIHPHYPASECLPVFRALEVSLFGTEVMAGEEMEGIILPQYSSLPGPSASVLAFYSTCSWPFHCCRRVESQHGG